MHSESFLTCPAPAKLNLFLHVIGRREDGYHLLQTLFRFIDFGDTVHVRVHRDGIIERLGEVAGVPAEQDLAVRAARLLQQSAGITSGAQIKLEKRLPLAGGLGGGSSDAATTLIALNRLWDLRWSRLKLQDLGLRLGADLPVFLYGRSAFAEGVGERLQEIAVDPAWYVVLIPPVAVSTASVFGDPELTRDSSPIKILRFSAGPGRNDLESVVCRRYPEVAQHLEWLRQFGPAAMTGSGACVFAAFDSEQAANRVFRQRPGGMQGFVAKGLDRHPLCEWLD
jgi:4-diphosphocytidyl-2-C-methyl-D-erythritol kinase